MGTVKQELQTPDVGTLQGLLQELETVDDRQQELHQENATLTEKRAEIMEKIRALLKTNATDDSELIVEVRELTPDQKSALFSTLRDRIANTDKSHYERPQNILFADVDRALEANPAALWSLHKMEISGGLPDIVFVEGDEFVFTDCSQESPGGRRGLDYDEALEQSNDFGVSMLSEERYRALQKIGKFDGSTWSWVKTPAEIRMSGGALFGGRLGVRVGVGRFDARDHNGGGAWRGLLRVKKA